MAKRNPLFNFKKFYVTCDGKRFGPFHTKAKADALAEKIARVLDKPAKVFGEVERSANPKRKRSATKKRTTKKRVTKRRTTKRTTKRNTRRRR